MWSKSLIFVAFLLLCPSALVIGSEQCTFEDGPCSNWASTGCDDGACFVVRKVAVMKNGPTADRTIRSEDGSCAYSTKGVASRGTPYASLSHNATGPLCFTAWYHHSGTEHESAHFSVMRPDDDSPQAFYVTQREMAGSWQRVSYSERRQGAVVIQITHRVKDSPEKATFAVDDLTVESGPCPSEPRSGSCDFDWGDSCGYDFGSGDNTWKLEDTGRESFKSIDYSTNTILGGVVYLGTLGNFTTASLTSPSLKGRNEMQCLQFHYYIPWSLSNPEKSYSLAAATRGSSQTTELLWSRTSKRLIRAEWTRVDVAFKQESDFKIQLSCALTPEEFIPKPYCAFDAIRLFKCTGRRNIFDHHCNFEDGWCSWQNRYLPDPNVVSWLMGGEHLKTTLPRPPQDHTFANGTGSYLFVSNFERKKGDQAELIGEILSMDSRVTPCVEFWFIINGDESTDLKMLAIDPEHESRDNSPLWSHKGGGPVTWQQGRVAALHRRRPIFLATMGLASIPAYIALDDITVKESDKCDTLPTSAGALSAVELLSCTFERSNLCRWSSQGTTSRTWTLGPPLFATLGPPALPDGVKGGLIHASGSILEPNQGLLRLVSPIVGVQTEPACVSVWYHMFGARGTNLRLSLITSPPTSGFVRLTSVLVHHRGRTTTDKWYNVRRTMNLDTPHNQLTFETAVFKALKKAAIVALGPIQVTAGACDVLTDSKGYCDFEFDECEWKSTSGWRRQAKQYWFKEPTLDMRSGPVNSVYVLTVTQASSPPNGATVTSPKWPGQNEPQCLEFWYLEEKGGDAGLQVELVVNDAHTVVWRKPAHMERQWMLARVDIVQDKTFQVAFRANFSGSLAQSLSIDDLILRPDACDHPAECDFTDGLCGYVNKFDGCFRWLVGTGRLENPHLYRGAPVPQGRSSTFAYLDLTTDRAEDESEEVPKKINPIALQSPLFDVAEGGIDVAIQYFRKGFDISTANLSVSCYNDGASPKRQVVHQFELDEVSVWTTANLTLEQGTQCQLVIQVVRGAWTNGTMAIGRIKVTKSQLGVHPKPASNSAMYCTFEDETTCGWNPNGALLPWMLNDPAKNIPDYPRFDHTLRAYRGRFIFASIGKNKSFGTAELKSPDLEIKATDGACLSFWHFTDHDKRAHITVLADGRFLFGSGTRKNHRWNHVLVAFKVPTPKFKLQIQVHLESGLIGLDDIQITEGTCPLRDFCPFEPAYSCPMHQGAGSFTPWIPLIAQEIGIPDNTLKNLKGYYLYLNTTAVRSHHPASRVFMATRPPTEATCVTFWWKGRGIPSQLNVYRFTKETAMRDPLLSVSTRDEEDWWNVRTLTIKSKRKWNLVFEVIAAEDERRESGVMIDDVEFADGECPKYEFCTFEEECLPWLVLNRDDDASFEPQRAGSFPQLPRDHTTQTEDGYYLLYKSPGVRGNHSTLVLRDTTRYRCASLWYYLPAMTNGVQLLLKDNPVEEAKGVWKRQQFSYPSGWMNAVRAVSGSNPSGFVAVDDVLVNELHCDELGRSTQMFDCGNKQTVLVERVCDFVVDCRNGADERNCGQCDFSEGTCGWNLNWYRNGDTMAWRRERIGYVSGSPRIGADTRHTGHYLMLYSNLTKSQLTGQAAIISPMIRNTDKLCTMRFWFNYVNNGSSSDVELIMELDPYELSIWTLSALNRAPEQGVWNEAIIAIGRYKRDIRFQFSSTQWPQGRALFAVDSIDYSGCSLPARHNNCTKMDFSCANGACVSRHERCNYVDDCGDNSDEQGCWDHRLGCNFDTSFCDWVPGVPWDEDQDTWALKPPGPSLLTSPTRDHTTGSPDGNFVILRTHAKATNATLYGPALDNTENCSVTFFYTVQGKSGPQLTLNVRSAKDGPWKTVWKQSEPTQFWHFVVATVDFTETDPYQVAFTGEHRASGQEGYIAIDDVAFSETCKTYDKELPPAPTPTLPPSACGADMFRCGDNEECIPLAQVCDFKEHCSNGMDEARCGACDFSQDLCGLENEDPNGRFGWSWTMAQIGKNNNIFPTTDSRLDEGGAYAAYCLLNPDVPLGAPRAMVTPRLGQVAHSCTVSFYVYVPDASSSILIFGVLPKSATSTASSTAHPLSMLTGRVKTGRWTKASIKTGNWDAGARFFYEAGAPGMSIDQTKYLNCHPDTQSEGWEASRHVSCDFSEPLDCGWFPERSAATLRWVLYIGGAGTARLRWQPTDSGARNGAYMYARNRFFQEKIAHLVSVRMSPTPENGRCFTFWYNMWHPNLGQLNLLRRVDNATSILWSRSGPQGKAWQQAQIPVLSDDPFQLVFEAILKPQNPGMIAIDNFELKNDSCDAKNVCTFETGSCGWKLHNWEVTKGSSVMLPTADHGSQSAAGGFALVNPPSGRMVSPPGSYDTTKNRCLRFWFFIAGATETLNVTQVVDDQQEDALWFGTRVDAPAERWYSAAVALTSYQGSVSTVFEGTTSGGAGTAVAVDDISHGEKPCPPPGSCSFEEDMCNWHNAEDLNHMQWYRHSGRTVSGSSDLENDHTLGSKEGHYLLLDSEDMSEKRFGSLQSQTLNFGPAVCFKLYYNMKKGSDASLKIKFLDSSGAPSGEQKTVLATAPTEWTLLSVERHDLPKHFSIVITGSAGSSSGDLGIDDIDVHPGKCDSSKVITVSPQPGVSTTHVSTHPYNTESMASSVTGLPVPTSEITAAPITSTSGSVSSPVPLPRCARGQFNCRDGATCIPSMLVCDGVRDCPNGIDEKCANANACTSDEFLCASRTPSSCLPRYVLCDGKEDCFGGADEYLCRECPHFLCLNGGLCWWSVREPYPSCHCPEDYEGRRCQINKKHELEDKPQELQDVGSNGPIVTGVLVVLAFVLIGAVVVVAVLRRGRAERLNTPMCISNPSFNAQAEETQTAT